MVKFEDTLFNYDFLMPLKMIPLIKIELAITLIAKIQLIYGFMGLPTTRTSMKLNTSNITIIKRLLVGRNNRPLLSILGRIDTAELSTLYGKLNRREIQLLTEALLSLNIADKVLIEVPEQQLTDVLHKINDIQKQALIEKATLDSAFYLLSLLNDGEQEELLEKLPSEKKSRLKQFLEYPESSTGRMMHTEFFSISVSLNAKEALNEIRNKAQHQSIYYIYCVNEKKQLVGILSLRQIAVAAEDKALSDIVKKDVIAISPDSPVDEAAQLISRYDLIAIPVVNPERQLIGIITVDDILDVIQEQATANIYAQAGLQEDDRVFTPAFKSVKNRLPWMFLNLFLAAIASSVVSLFEGTMSHLIVLASLKNIVAGVGGNTAIQSLTVVTRGLATGDFSFISKKKALMKELIVGASVGLFTAGGAALLTLIWKHNLLVAYVIFIAMLMNSVVAALAGGTVPIILKHYGRDPATGGGVIVTVITDIFGFFSFLGIATLVLKWMHAM